MLVILDAVPRNALADVHVERTTTVDRDGFVERMARLFGASDLAKRRGEPAIDQREVGIETDHPSRRIDCRRVVARVIMADRHAIEMPGKERVARVEPDRGFESDQPFL